jgi:hypothetical protein
LGGNGIIRKWTVVHGVDFGKFFHISHPNHNGHVFPSLLLLRQIVCYSYRSDTGIRLVRKTNLVSVSLRFDSFSTLPPNQERGGTLYCLRLAFGGIDVVIFDFFLGFNGWLLLLTPAHLLRDFFFLGSPDRIKHSPVTGFGDQLLRKNQGMAQ